MRVSAMRVVFALRLTAPLGSGPRTGERVSYTRYMRRQPRLDSRFDGNDGFFAVSRDFGMDIAVNRRAIYGSTLPWRLLKQGPGYGVTFFRRGDGVVGHGVLVMTAR